MYQVRSRMNRWWTARRLVHGAALVMGVATVTACSASDIVGDPAGRDGSATTPDAVKTPEGALAFYEGVVSSQATAFSSTLLASGTIADELKSINNQDLALDSRRLPEGPAGTAADSRAQFVFTTLQTVRAAARQGRGILAEYLPGEPDALTGHLYAIEAMADVQLAELFCSGIPLSTVDYNGDVTVRGGSTSVEVYREAIALFDSALALSTDSVRFVNFAKIGKARAVLDTGDVQVAAQIVADIPTDFQYLVQYGANELGNAFKRPSPTSSYTAMLAVVSNEGGNGLVYGSSADWRTTWVSPTPTLLGFSIPGDVATKYNDQGTTPIVLASGIEARLIEAEAALKQGNVATWLTTLNALRTNGDSTLVVLRDPVTQDSIGYDVVWGPGAGGAIGMAPLTDPAGDSLTGAAATKVRVDTLFSERAAWLYLTGHRLGDMRRMVRQYGRVQTTVFPIGPYTAAVNAGASYLNFGNDVNLPIPAREQETNAKFTGCFNRDA